MVPARPNFPAEKLLELAFDSLHAERFREAEGRFRQVLLHDAANVAALTRLAFLAYDSGRAAEACDLLGRAVSHDPDNVQLLGFYGLMHRQMGLPREALDIFLRLLAKDSSQAVAWNSAAVCLHETGRNAEALEFYLRATELKPDYAEALNNMGILLLQERDPLAAAEFLRRAVAVEPGFADAHFNLGVALRNQLLYSDAFTHLREARRLQPANADYAGGLGEVLSLVYDPDARRHLEDGVRLAPTDPEKHWNLALDRLKHGEYAAGWPEFEWRWQRLKEKQSLARFPHPVWSNAPGEDLRDTTLLLHCEQGFGDSIQFLRYLPLVLAQNPREVILLIQPALLELAQQLASSLRAPVTVLADTEPPPPHTWHAALMSLPAAFRTTLETVPPPLRLSAAPRPARLDGPIRIGLAWSGNPKHDRDRERSIPISALRELFAIPGCEWTCLQVGPPAYELFRSAVTAHFPDLIDFATTAAILDTLDLVIAADTAVAHLAASQGVPTWILLPYIADWRWLTPAHCTAQPNPWYPETRIFRQSTFPDSVPQAERWSPVIAQVAAELAKLVSQSPR